MDLNQLEQLVTQWGKDRNIIGGGSPLQQTLKLMSEVGETADALLGGNQAEFHDGLGDCAVVLIILAAQTGTSLTSCLEVAYSEIKNRKGVLYKGTFIKESDPNYASACADIINGQSARKFFGQKAPFCAGCAHNRCDRCEGVESGCGCAAKGHDHD